MMVDREWLMFRPQFVDYYFFIGHPHEFSAVGFIAIIFIFVRTKDV